MNNEETVFDSKNANESRVNAPTDAEQTKAGVMKVLGRGGKAAYTAGGMAAGAGMTMGGQAIASPKAPIPDEMLEEKPEEADSDVEVTAEEEESRVAAENAPEPEEAIIATATGVRVAQVSDDQSFSQAFADARAQVGPGGVFEWHGRVYGTYYKDEWDNMTAEEKHEYQASIDYNDVMSEENIAHHNASRHDGNAHRTTATEGSSSTQDGSSEEVDVQVIAVGQTDLNEDGILENAAVLEIAGHEVLVVDIDQDGTADIAFCDVDGDGQLEYQDLEGENIAMPVQSAGDAYLSQNDTAPDYMNDANVGMYEC